MIKEHMKLLISIVDAQLFKTVCLKILKSKNVQNTDKLGLVRSLKVDCVIFIDIKEWNKAIILGTKRIKINIRKNLPKQNTRAYFKVRNNFD